MTAAALDVGASRLTGHDLVRVACVGLRTRRLRVLLSALGISIGIASIVGVLGISQSSKSGLLAELGQLGNLLDVQPGSTLGGNAAQLPLQAEAMASRIAPVTGVTALGSLQDEYVYRNPYVPAVQTGGIAVTAADPAFVDTLGAKLAVGTFLNAATSHFPAVVLGSDAAQVLGIDNLDHPTQVWLGGHWFTVIGILAPVTLVDQLDTSAFIGFPVAESLFGFDGHATDLYVRTVPSQVTAVDNVLAATVDPANPSEVSVQVPSDELRSEIAAKGAYNGLFLALGAVALLVGGVGIANVMVIAVLERRSEIGLRRALGASRRHVGEQFLAEALLLALIGGVAGTVLGVASTAVYAYSQNWSTQVPSVAFYGGVAAALLIGAVAGLYPAMRAARLSPTDALRSV